MHVSHLFSSSAQFFPARPSAFPSSRCNPPLYIMSFMNSRQRQQNAWQRNQLLPTHTNSGRSSPYDPSKMTDRDLLSLESQNDEELSGLHSKVAMLKKITMDIGHEVRDSTAFLGDLDQDFGRTGGLLNSTYTRLKVMASTQNGRYMCYMIAFCVFALIFAYFFIYRR